MIRAAVRRWLAAPDVAAIERENKALRRRIFVLRDALEQTAWRSRMNIRIPDNAAAYHVATDAVMRDPRLDLP